MGQTFIDHPVEKDRLYHLLAHVQYNQRHGNMQNVRLWRLINGYQKAIAIQAARQIVAYAQACGADVIVLEHLNMKGRIRGAKKQKLHLWRKREIAHRIEALAARSGIRTTYICPYNTSRLAYDGSGPVVRDKDNAALCTFTTGKRYNTDLSARKNIAARYLIRIYSKQIPADIYKALQAKVPELAKRTLCMLSTVINLVADYAALRAA